jgi:predicted RNase H-like nuclease (RuvC/YqgF family)
MSRIRDIAVIAVMVMLAGALTFMYFKYQKTRKTLARIEEEFAVAVKSTVELDSVKAEVARLTQELKVSAKLREAYEKTLKKFRDENKHLFVPVDIKNLKHDTSNLLESLGKHRDFIFQSDSLD